MIHKLRKKFIVAAMLAVFLVLLLLIGAINILNYRSMVAEADETLQILSSNNGVFPGQMFRAQDQPKDRIPPQDQQSPPPEKDRKGAFDARRGENRELAYQSRYFAAWFDAEGNCTRLNTENLASLTEEEATALAESVYASGREKGFSGDYRYCSTLCGEETMLLFLNCQRELGSFRTFLYASFGISLAGIIAVFLLLLLFSGRIVRPIAESYEKQKRFITDGGRGRSGIGTGRRERMDRGHPQTDAPACRAHVGPGLSVQNGGRKQRDPEAGLFPFRTRGGNVPVVPGPCPLAGKALQLFRCTGPEY